MNEIGTVDGYEGDASFGEAPGPQMSVLAVDPDAGADGTVILAFMFKAGVTIPAGTKTFRLTTHSAANANDFSFVVDALSVGVNGDPVAAYSNLGTMTLTQTGTTQDRNARWSLVFTHTIAAGDKVLIKVTHDTSATTVISGDFLHVIRAEIEIA